MYIWQFFLFILLPAASFESGFGETVIDSVGKFTTIDTTIGGNFDLSSTTIRGDSLSSGLTTPTTLTQPTSLTTFIPPFQTSTAPSTTSQYTSLTILATSSQVSTILNSLSSTGLFTTIQPTSSIAFATLAKPSSALKSTSTTIAGNASPTTSSTSPSPHSHSHKKLMYIGISIVLALLFILLSWFCVKNRYTCCGKIYKKRRTPTTTARQSDPNIGFDINVANKFELPTPFNVARSMKATFLTKFELPGELNERPNSNGPFELSTD